MGDCLRGEGIRVKYVGTVRPDDLMIARASSIRYVGSAASPEVAVVRVAAVGAVSGRAEPLRETSDCSNLSEIIVRTSRRFVREVGTIGDKCDPGKSVDGAFDEQSLSS
jgi:hypothetical protein